MKREVEREKKIPAFSINLGELEALWERLLALFNNTENVYGSIEIALSKEKLEFDNIEELKEYPDLKGKITDFSISLLKDSRRVYLRSGSFFNPKSVVRASAETEAWCAGTVETVISFLRSYKVWYSWLAYAPLGWILFAYASIIPAIAINILPKGAIGKVSIIGYLFTLFALAFLYFYKFRLFPSASLRITDEENFIKRYSSELSLIIALLSVILTIVNFFLKK